MSKRYTVSVSDEMSERMDAMKGELSPSAVFQKAMEAELNKKEQFRNKIIREASMEDIIERLRAEKEQEGRDTLEQGKKEGLEWAKQASYSELKYAATSFNNEIKSAQWVYRTMVFDDEKLGYYFEDLEENAEEYERFFDTEDNSDVLTEEPQKWLEGWLDAVTCFWDEVSKKL